MIRGSLRLVWPLLGVLTVCAAGCSLTTDNQQVAVSVTILLGTTSGSAGHFTADLGFFVAGDAGSGDLMAQVVVRLCAHYAGTVGTHSQVTVADLTCPAQAPPRSWAPPASTVKLHG